MRSGALTLIIICELAIAFTWKIDVDTSSLSFLTTLIIVVIAAFGSSAMLRNIKSLTLTKNYGVSGVVGVVSGMLYYSWVSDHLDDMLTWLKNYGTYILLLMILVSAIILYLTKAGKHKEVSTPTVPESVDPVKSNPEGALEN